jgi:hypothetical protein
LTADETVDMSALQMAAYLEQKKVYCLAVSKVVYWVASLAARMDQSMAALMAASKVLHSAALKAASRVEP